MNTEIMPKMTDPSPAAEAIREKPGKLLEHLLKAHAADLNEGAADRIREAVRPDRLGGSLARVAKEFFDYVHGPQGYRLMRYGAGPDPAKSPVLHVAEKLPFKDAKAAASRLEMHLADLARPGERGPVSVGLSKSTPQPTGPRWGEIAAGLVNAAQIGDSGVHGPDVSDLLSPGWKETWEDPRESRMRGILDGHFSDVDYNVRRRVAKDLASSVGGDADHELVRKAARALSGAIAERAYGASIRPDDPRLNALPPRRDDAPAPRFRVG